MSENRFRKLRIDNNLTQKQLAAILSVTQGEISKIEKGTDCRQEILKAYCTHFHVSADYLLGLIDKPTHKNVTFSEQTGLSESAIDTLEYLHAYSKYHKGSGYDMRCIIIDFLLQNNHVKPLFLREGDELLSLIALYFSMDENTGTSFSLPDGTIIPAPSEGAVLYQITSKLSEYKKEWKSNDRQFFKEWLKRQPNFEDKPS